MNVLLLHLLFLLKSLYFHFFFFYSIDMVTILINISSFSQYLQFNIITLTTTTSYISLWFISLSWKLIYRISINYSIILIHSLLIIRIIYHLYRIDLLNNHPSINIFVPVLFHYSIFHLLVLMKLVVRLLSYYIGFRSQSTSRKSKMWWL